MKKGFTLTEVLITLGIIGVVAVLTLPNILKNHQKKVLVTQLHRTYNTIVNAMPSYMDEVHATSLYDTDAFNANKNRDDVTSLVNFIKNNFKTSKICTANTTGGTAACKGSAYKNLDGGDSGMLGSDGDYACTILKTGATICFDLQWDKDDFPTVDIDVNGPQGPNIWGRDAYRLEFNNSGYLAESFDTNPDNTYHKPENCGETIYGNACFNKIIGDGWVMDY